MRYLNTAKKALAIVSLTGVLSACAPIPLYQPPSSDVERSHIKIDFQDQSIISGVAILDKVEKPIICGQPMKVERMALISKGNPLISDKNPTGVDVTASRRMTFSFMGLNDGYPACGRAFSFVPEVGKRYVVRVSNNAVLPCTLDLLQYTSSDGAAAEVPSFQFEACLQN